MVGRIKTGEQSFALFLNVYKMPLCVIYSLCGIMSIHRKVCVFVFLDWLKNMLPLICKKTVNRTVGNFIICFVPDDNGRRKKAYCKVSLFPIHCVFVYKLEWVCKQSRIRIKRKVLRFGRTFKFYLTAFTMALNASG